MEPAVAAAIDLGDLMDAMPAGALVIDGVGQILFATDDVAALVRRSPDDLVGDSVLSYVSEETAWIYAAAVAMAGDYPEVIGGPMRITVVAADGTETVADLWTKNLLADPRIGGIVCLITPQTTTMGLAEALSAAAEHEPFTQVAALVARAMGGHPVVCDAAVVATGSTGFRLVAAAGVPDDVVDLLDDGPWREAVTTGVRSLHKDLDALPAPLAEAARAAGYESVWVEPITDGDLPARGALVCWKRRSLLPSPNQITSMHHGASIAAMAWARHEAIA